MNFTLYNMYLILLLVIGVFLFINIMMGTFYGDKYITNKKEYLDLKMSNNDIYIAIIDRTMGGIVPPTTLYSKVITIESGEQNGTIKICHKDDCSEKQISRDVVNELLKNIDTIRTLPSAKSENDPLYDGILLSLYIGDKKWVNGKPMGCVHYPPSIEITKEQQNIYNQIIDVIKMV